MGKIQNIEQSVFESVMDGIECDTGDDLGTVGFMARNHDYSISFYGNQVEGHDLIVDEFGKMKNGEWVSFEPTEMQIYCMNQLIQNEVKRIQKLEEEKRNQEALAMKEDVDEMIYGHPGAMYGKWY